MVISIVAGPYALKEITREGCSKIREGSEWSAAAGLTD